MNAAEDICCIVVFPMLGGIETLRRLEAENEPLETNSLVIDSTGVRRYFFRKPFGEDLPSQKIGEGVYFVSSVVIGGEAFA